MTSCSTSLPYAPRVELDPRVVLQPPLSRCGHGPGLILIRPSHFAECQEKNKSLDPEPLQKWAEESYAIVQISVDAESSGDEACVLDFVKTAIERLISLPECDKKDQFGLLLYGSPADYAPGFVKILDAIVAARVAAVVYFGIWDTLAEIPALVHAPGASNGIQETDSRTVYSYPDVSSAGFIVPGHADFKYSTAGVAHTRSLSFLKKHLDGPYFNLEKIWEEHTYYEFGDRSVEKTMATMVQEPYVNHVPTMTGGIGRARLSNFYLNHFIFNNPDDTALELISRTVGIDRVVDEFIFSLTHNKEIDWLIPGIPPTRKPLRIPFTSVVNIRGDRLYHEHIAWDQATVLVQLGLMPEYLPYPYALPDGRLPGRGKRFEYQVPAAGVQTAEKLENEHKIPSNQMFEYKDWTAGIREDVTEALLALVNTFHNIEPHRSHRGMTGNKKTQKTTQYAQFLVGRQSELGHVRYPRARASAEEWADYRSAKSLWLMLGDPGYVSWTAALPFFLAAVKAASGRLIKPRQKPKCLWKEPDLYLTPRGSPLPTITDKYSESHPRLLRQAIPVRPFTLAVKHTIPPLLVATDTWL
ncbi:uncharacterized protein CDV56_109072 [Aspergillus thermomutatus]|uniref:SnoaL-like domain-containing protein n=1 Tax=Aspergillus thermomutatus TaxID=41047 RepID=A0A397HMN5_ASPTH|nr:uncharacterized protein CDV56_109072 [Aspergillus thermomutatus]RHZ62584.1 hypothetical protein CDV56_109072 [Aspergillus thermomutatus]